MHTWADAAVAPSHTYLLHRQCLLPLRLLRDRIVGEKPNQVGSGLCHALRPTSVANECIITHGVGDARSRCKGQERAHPASHLGTSRHAASENYKRDLHYNRKRKGFGQRKHHRLRQVLCPLWSSSVLFLNSRVATRTTIAYVIQ